MFYIELTYQRWTHLGFQQSRLNKLQVRLRILQRKIFFNCTQILFQRWDPYDLEHLTVKETMEQDKRRTLRSIQKLLAYHFEDYLIALKHQLTSAYEDKKTKKSK